MIILVVNLLIFIISCIYFFKKLTQNNNINSNQIKSNDLILSDLTPRVRESSIEDGTTDLHKKSETSIVKIKYFNLNIFIFLKKKEFTLKR